MPFAIGMIDQLILSDFEKEVLSQQATGALSQLPEITLQDQPDDVEDDYWAFIVGMVMQKHQQTCIFEIG